MAFQKWKGLPATTVVDTNTAVALEHRDVPSRSRPQR